MSDYVRRSAAEWAKVWEQAGRQWASEWLEMIRDAVELAEAEEGPLPRLAREAASDGGPTHADLRGEVDHGD